MNTIPVEVSPNHIDRLSKGRKPLLALLELIWNALDADATRVSVNVIPNGLNGISSIEISDNGHGLDIAEATAAFGKLGDSWKFRAGKTRSLGRLLHGRHGEGRFKSLSVGSNISWTTRYKSNDLVHEYTVVFDTQDKGRFTVSEVNQSSSTKTGTTVLISNPTAKLASLDGPSVTTELAKHLAMYLKQYTDVLISWNGETITPEKIISAVQDITFVYISEDGRTHNQLLTIIEWLVPLPRGLYYCSQGGFAYEESTVGIHAPGFIFTAYLCSDYVEELAGQDLLVVELGDTKRLKDEAQAQLRKYFERRALEKSARVVEDWKNEEIYPFSGAPTSVVEEAERQVFDMVAVNVSQYISDFRAQKQQSKKLTFNLLRYALASSPSSLKKIFEDVLDLPNNKREEFAAILERTSLSSFISASKLVTDRIVFLNGLESYLYDSPYKEDLLERIHLQRLVADNTWIFGDEFYLTNDDEKLITVLKKHLSKHIIDLGAAQMDLKKPVRMEGKQTGTVDLVLSTHPLEGQAADKLAASTTNVSHESAMIGKTLPRAPGEMMKNLVVELKRPTQQITPHVIQQVRDYALAIAQDERFHQLPAHWTFWALSNEISESALEQATQQHLAPGVVLEKGPEITRPFGYRIIVKSWAQVLKAAKDRLEFYRDQLTYSPTLIAGRKYLQETYNEYVPNLDN